eukprot:COSAG06_NODE_152_length_21942_cov_4.593234_18_plen_61_part_00
MSWRNPARGARARGPLQSRATAQRQWYLGGRSVSAGRGAATLHGPPVQAVRCGDAVHSFP